MLIKIYYKKINYQKINFHITIYIFLLCNLFTKIFSQQEKLLVNTNNFPESNIKLISAKLKLVSNYPNDDRYLIVRLSMNHQYIATLNHNNIVSIYPFTNDLNNVSSIFSTENMFFYSTEIAWCDNKLLISGIPYNKGNSIDEIIEMKEKSQIREWEPGNNFLKNYLPYGASKIIPDNNGEKVALFDRTVDSLTINDKKSYVTIFDNKLRKEIKTIKIPKGTYSYMSYPISWSKDNKSLFIIVTDMINEESVPCPTLYSVTVKGTIRKLTRSWIDINNKKVPMIFSYYQWSFNNMMMSNNGDLVCVIGGMPFPSFRIGYFDTFKMMHEMIIKEDHLPDIWKNRWKNNTLYIFTLTPDCEHFIFQDTEDMIVNEDGIELYPIYIWGFKTHLLEKLGQSPEIDKAYGWDNDILLFSTIPQKVKENSGNTWKKYTGIISLNIILKKNK